MEKKNKPRIIFVALAIILLVVIAMGTGISIGYMNAHIVNYNKQTVQEKPKEDKKIKLEKTKLSTSLQESEISDISEVVEKSIASVVAITVEVREEIDTFFGTFDRDVNDFGSGIIVERDDENIYIITNNHVVDGSKKIYVTFDGGKTEEGEIRGVMEYTDLALISVKTSLFTEKELKKFAPIKFGKSSKLNVGEMVFALGNALGYGQSLTVGYVSAKERKVTTNEVSLRLIQTDAAINPGNSGGALLNLRGELVGMNSMKLSKMEIEGMGYAIPVDSIKPLIKEMKDYKEVDEDKRGYLGIYYKEVDEATHIYFNIPYGLYIMDFTDESAAMEAGLQKGDVITSINGYDGNAISQVLVNKKIGDTVDIGYARYEDGEYKEKSVNVTLKAKIEDDR